MMVNISSVQLRRFETLQNEFEPCPHVKIYMKRRRKKGKYNDITETEVTNCFSKTSDLKGNIQEILNRRF